MRGGKQQGNCGISQISKNIINPNDRDKACDFFLPHIPKLTTTGKLPEACRFLGYKIAVKRGNHKPMN